MKQLELLENFKANYTKLIQDLAIEDEKDPLSKETMNELLELQKHWLSLQKDKKLQIAKLETIFNNRNETALQKYQNEVKQLNMGLNKNIKKVTSNHMQACKNLKSEIEKTRRNTRYTIEQLEIDFNYFITTSEQNKEILNTDFYEAKKRYDYQKEEARDSYLEVVKKNNYALDHIKAQLAIDYQESTSSYQKDQTELLEKLHQLIDNKNEELEILVKALEKEKNNMKEKYRQESASLNENVKKYADEKNNTIDQARSQYFKSISDANIERENKRQVYQSKSQALLREFVTKINEIDETAAIQKKEFENKTDEIKRDYYSKIYQKTYNFHQQIQKIYASSTSETLDKYTHHLIQYKNKQYMNEVALEKKLNELKLFNLTKEHTIELQESKHNKNFLEIDKNYAIKDITIQEQFDNKYYQEKDNVYENDFNYIVKTANFRFSQKANILRCQSQIRTKLLERNYDGIEANYYKKIETIQNTINSYRLEIKLAEEIYELVLAFQQKNYEDQLHLNEVTNLLEIEKNKLLREYNVSQYDYNIKNITLSKDYGLKKIDLENEKAEKTKNLKIELENYMLKKNTVSTSFSIKHEQLEEKYNKIKLQLKNNNDLNVAKEHYLSSLKNADVFYINQSISRFRHFIESLTRNYYDGVRIIFHSFTVGTQYHYLDSFLNSFIQIYLDLIMASFDQFCDSITSIIDKRLNYIYTFKYKNSLDTLKENYLETENQIKENKVTIIDEMDSASKTIENFKQKIFTLINDNEMLIQNNKLRRKRKLDAISLAAIRDNELKIKEYKEKIDDFNEMNKMHNDDLLELAQKTIENTNTYSKEEKRITKMFKDDSYINEHYKQIIKDFNVKIHKKMNLFRLFLKKEVFNEKQLLKKSYATRKKLKEIIHLIHHDLQQNFSDYAESSNQETLSKRQKCKLEYKLEIQKFNKQYEKANSNFQKEYQLTIASYEKQIQDHTLLINNTVAHYNGLLLDSSNTFQLESKQTQQDFNRRTDQFLLSYYALDDNNQKIIAYHQKKHQQDQEQFDSNKLNCIRSVNQEKEANNEKLKTFINTKNEEIEHLPIAFKFNSRMLNNETKKKNNQIHFDLKDAKVAYNNERKRIDKEINNLKNDLNQNKAQNDLSQKQSIAKEKKDHRISLRQSLKKIKINL